MPEFPGGSDALMQFLSENIKYPIDAEEAGIQGRVILSLVIEKNGKVSNVNVVKSVSPSLDKEAERVVNLMPQWIPGMNGIHPVRVKYTIPITFRLNDPEPKATTAATHPTATEQPKPASESKPAATPKGTRKHMKFLGLELGGNAKDLEKALRAKGFKDGGGWDNSGNSIFLSGMVYGKTTEVCIDATGGRANAVSVTEMADTEAKAKQRCNVFKQKMIAEYGNGYVPYETRYDIPLTYGNVSINYGAFDSGDVELGFTITDYAEVLPRPDYFFRAYDTGWYMLSDEVKWNQVVRELKDRHYVVTSTTATVIKGQHKLDSYLSNITVKRASTNAVRANDVVVTTTNSIGSVEDKMKFGEMKLVKETPQGVRIYREGNVTTELTPYSDHLEMHLTR